MAFRKCTGGQTSCPWQIITRAGKQTPECRRMKCIHVLTNPNAVQQIPAGKSVVKKKKQ